jgi:hypothetical protein
VEKRNVKNQAQAASTQSEAVTTQSGETPAATVNFTLVFKRNHPQNRASYGVPGVPGLVVIQRDLVAGTTPVEGQANVNTLGGMPEFITVSMPLVSPRSDNKAAKAEAAAAKLAERAAKAQAKADQQAAKLAEKKAKADAALEAAKAKVEAAKTEVAAEPATV